MNIALEIAPETDDVRKELQDGDQRREGKDKMAFRKIVLCSDGSDEALAAAQSAAEIAEKFASDIVLVNVFNPDVVPVPFVGIPESVLMAEGNVGRYAEDLQTDVEKQTGSILDAAKLRYTCRREIGHPVDRILAAARDENADLIVLGSRGLTKWKSLVLGSVSEGVVRHATCPVLVAREHPHSLRKVLLASDGSEGAQKATEAALEIARKFGIPLGILNVVEPSLISSHGGPEIHDMNAIAGRSRDLVKRNAQQPAEAAGIACEMEQVEGTPAPTIIRYAENYGYDLIVVGSRGMGGFKSLLLGSVSNYVAHHANGPLLVVR